MTTEEKIKTLSEIARQIAATSGGPYGKGLKPVPGEGNPDAKIMFIGEGPGFYEDQQGRPFVGVSGRLLRKTIVENGWKEGEVFITNIVKFRPPENRDPTPEEIEFFREFLDKQIETISPEIIVTLGRFSMYKFLGVGVSISRIHGIARTINWGGKSVTIFPMYHPAAALRATGMMNQFLEDFKKLKTLVDGDQKVVEPEVIKPVEKKTEQLQLV